MEGGSLILAVVFIFISIPFFIWKIPPNWGYGVRCPKTLAPGNEEIWYKVNKFCAKTFLVCSITMLISAYLTWTYQASLSQVWYWVISIATFNLPFVALGIVIVYLIKA